MLQAIVDLLRYAAVGAASSIGIAILFGLAIWTNRP